MGIPASVAFHNELQSPVRRILAASFKSLRVVDKHRAKEYGTQFLKPVSRKLQADKGRFEEQNKCLDCPSVLHLLIEVVVR